MEFESLALLNFTSCSHLYPFFSPTKLHVSLGMAEYDRQTKRRAYDSSAVEEARRSQRLYREEMAQSLSQVRFCPKDVSKDIILSTNRRTIIGERGYRTARCSHGIDEGMMFYEVSFNQTDPCFIPPNQSSTPLPSPHLRVGWAREKASLNCPVGFDEYGYAYGDRDGVKCHSQVSKAYGEPWGPGDIIGCLLVFPSTRKIRDSKIPKHSHSSTSSITASSGTTHADEKNDHHPHSQSDLSSYHNATIHGHNTSLGANTLGDGRTSLTPNSPTDLAALAARTSQAGVVNNNIDQIRRYSTIHGSYVAFYKNGLYQGKAYTDIPGGLYLPAVSSYMYASCSVNFGPDFVYPPTEITRDEEVRVPILKHSLSRPPRMTTTHSFNSAASTLSSTPAASERIEGSEGAEGTKGTKGTNCSEVIIAAENGEPMEKNILYPFLETFDSDAEFTRHFKNILTAPIGKVPTRGGLAAKGKLRKRHHLETSDSKYVAVAKAAASSHLSEMMREEAGEAPNTALVSGSPANEGKEHDKETSSSNEENAPPQPLRQQLLPASASPPLYREILRKRLRVYPHLLLSPCSIEYEALEKQRREQARIEMERPFKGKGAKPEPKYKKKTGAVMKKKVM